MKRSALMYQNLITVIESISKESKNVEANAILCSLMKLRQIANGFILDHNQFSF
jgi:hypothetical protein